MSEQDFRYTMPDGSQVEAFQMTEATRYQEGLWPEWMNSKMLLTTEGTGGRKKHYLNINDVETEIPEYGWVVNNAGKITAVPYEVMELATKVTRIVPKVPDIAKPQSDSALRLAAKITKRTFDDVKEADLATVEEANQNRQAIIDSMHPEDAAAQGLKQSAPPDSTELAPGVAETLRYEHDPYEDLQASGGLPEAQALAPPPHGELMVAARSAFIELQNDDPAAAMTTLREVLGSLQYWCDCAPGRCSGTTDVWDCRQKSPLVQ